MALSRCSLVRRIQAYCPYRLANDLPHRIPVWETNRTLQVFGEKHNQIRIAKKRTVASPALQPSPPTCATIKLSSARPPPLLTWLIKTAPCFAIVSFAPAHAKFARNATRSAAMDKTHIPSDNKREARARFITVDGALHRKPSMGALLREGLQSLFHAPGILQEDFVILLRRLDGPCQDICPHNVPDVQNETDPFADHNPHVPPSAITAKGQRK